MNPHDYELVTVCLFKNKKCPGTSVGPLFRHEALAAATAMMSFIGIEAGGCVKIMAGAPVSQFPVQEGLLVDLKFGDDVAAEEEDGEL